jgi:hypothetical protein
VGIVQIQKGEEKAYFFVSIGLSILAFWYLWHHFAGVEEKTVITVYDYWYVWIRPVIIGIVGIITLLSAVLFLFRHPVAAVLFQSGISLIVFILVANLVVLVIRGGHHLIQGGARPVLEGVVREPHKVFLVPVIILVLSIMSAIRKK